MKITSEFPPLLPRKEDGRIDFSACFKEGIAKAHARAAELSTSTAAAKTMERRDALSLLAEQAFAGVQHVSLVGYTGGGTDREWRFTHTDGTQFFKADPASGESYGTWAMKCAEEAERNRAKLWFSGRRFGKSYLAGEFLARESNRFDAMWVDEADDIPLPAWFQLETEPASAEDRAARKSAKVTITVDASRMLAAVGGGWGRDGFNHGFIRDNDRPGIAAMAAKNVQPTPEPVVRVAGVESTASEITQALQLLRGQNAPAVKETLRGLLCVREGFDHRLGAWKG